MFENITTESQRKKVLASLVILCDTREKKNDHITKYFDDNNIPWERRKLDTGDYAPYIPKNESLGIEEDISFANEIMVERKGSLEELSGNFSDSTMRIYKEFAKSPKNKVLLIENATYKHLITGAYNTQLNPKAFWAKLLSVWHKYDLPFVFMPDPKFSGQFIHGYFYYYLRSLIKVK